MHLLGAANRRFAGKRVKIRFMATGKVVARPKVRTHRPVQRHREAAAGEAPGHQQARYQAGIAKEKSLRLKLVRRMLVRARRSRAARSRSPAASCARSERPSSG